MRDAFVSTVPSGLPFARVLAEELLRRHGSGEELSRVLLLLPTRRACLAMREAFLAAGEGKPLLLPRIEPLGDVDIDLWMASALFSRNEEKALPSAMPRAERVMQLARLVHAFERTVARGKEKVSATMEHAVLLAEALSELLDECTRERVSPEGLRSLVEKKEFARHWEMSLEFLEIVLTHWPQKEREAGKVSMAARQDAMLSKLASFWKISPPAHPVVAAGTTGSIPATAELLSVIARLPQGEVVLPGLETQMEDLVWNVLGATHPQYVLRELLRRMEVKRAEVRMLGDVSALSARRAELIRQVMLPPEATDGWALLEEEGVVNGYAGMTSVTCRSKEHEAAVITLKLREVLGQEERTAMLVTPDRGLAKRVAAMLGRYDVRVDDSSGVRMTELPAAVFLTLASECALREAAPVPLLALLRHPLCEFGRSAPEVRRLAREIERCLLRGLRPAGGMEGLLQAADAHEEMSPAAKKLLHEVCDALLPLSRLLRFRAGSEIAFTELLQEHLKLAGQLAGAALWAGHEGSKLSAALQEIMRHAPPLGAIDPASYIGVLDNLLGAMMYQPPYGGHPRLSIMSPQEARLQQADVVILGGMNEGVWPPPLPSDPWMNNEMRQALGLPPQERGIGQSAHDVAMLCAAPEVMLTRSEKEGRSPGIPSRWWLRMEAVVGAERMCASGALWAAWGSELFAAMQTVEVSAPEVSPPLAARSDVLWVTQVETLMRDPYQYYASHILSLRPLEELDADLGASDFGEAVHTALQDYVAVHGEAMPPDALAQLEAVGKEALAKHFHHTQAEAFWWPRFRRIAAWYVAEETRRRAEGLVRVEAEKEMEHALQAGDKTYRLRARIDRMEYYGDDSLLIADYKTGTPPKAQDVQRGVACQMPLEAWIVAAEKSGVALRAPEYWKTGGGREPGKTTSIFGAAKNGVHVTGDHLAATENGVRGVLSYYALPEACYRICPDPELAPRYQPYDHLERLGEWSI